VARRNKVPTYGTLFDDHCPLPPCLAVCGKNCPNDSAFEQKYGALNYFKPNEWEGVVSATRAMEEYGASQNRGIGKHSSCAIGVENTVEDFINWLWDTIVVDVKFRKGALLPPQNDTQQVIMPVSNTRTMTPYLDGTDWLQDNELPCCGSYPPYSYSTHLGHIYLERFSFLLAFEAAVCAFDH
jgi:hypothetical protein